MKMRERFLLNGIYAKPAAPTVGRQHHPPAEVLSHETKAALTRGKFAEPRAHATFHTAIRQRLPPLGRVLRLLDFVGHGFAGSASAK
jgi:hypothetical protein